MPSQSLYPWYSIHLFRSFSGLNSNREDEEDEEDEDEGGDREGDEEEDESLVLSMGFISFSKFLTTSDMDMVFFGLVVSWVKVMHFGVST